jgi:hypothetical protein
MYEHTDAAYSARVPAFVCAGTTPEHPFDDVPSISDQGAAAMKLATT